MILSDKRLRDCEFELRTTKDLLERLSKETSSLRRRIRTLEENVPVTQDIQMKSPFGAKFFFTFKMPDGTSNGGFCNESSSLPKLIELVKEKGGTELVIKDETVYFNVNKTSFTNND